MFYRENLDTTLGDLGTLLKDRTGNLTETRVSPDEIKFHLGATDPTIKVGKKEFPVTEHAMGEFTDLLQIPTAFYKRATEKVDGKVLDPMLNQLLANTLMKDARVQSKQGHIVSVGEWGKVAIEPSQIVTATTNAFSTDAHIERLVDTPSFFGFDVRVPEKSKKGVIESGKTTDREGKKVGDVTAGGVRVGLNMKQGLAPSVEEYLFRLACTNGMVVPDTAGTLKMDARGQTVEEVIAEVEAMAELAFSRVERTIAHFYDLRQQKVDNPERALRTLARERGIPTRSMVALLDLAAGEDMPDSPSMFDVVNLVTNFANSPQIRNDGGRTLLEGAGGAVIGDHAARCGHCQQKVTG
jgi:hypothetical protein